MGPGGTGKSFLIQQLQYHFGYENVHSHCGPLLRFSIREREHMLNVLNIGLVSMKNNEIRNLCAMLRRKEQFIATCWNIDEIPDDIINKAHLIKMTHKF